MMLREIGVMTFKYYCEFCGKDFCYNCTVQEAHETNIYNKGDANVGCDKINKPMEAEIIENEKDVYSIERENSETSQDKVQDNLFEPCYQS